MATRARELPRYESHFVAITEQLRQRRLLPVPWVRQEKESLDLLRQPIYRTDPQVDDQRRRLV